MRLRQHGKKRAVPEGTAKFREETSKKQKATECLAAIPNIGDRSFVRKQFFALQHFIAHIGLTGPPGTKRSRQRLPTHWNPWHDPPHGTIVIPRRHKAAVNGAMRRTIISALAVAACLPALPIGARAQHPAPRATAITLPAPPPGLQCRQAITAAERATALPPQLMAAIARVESGRPDARGVVHPWPWTINAEGAGQFFETREAALAAVRALQARGVRSIDVGCMQVNLHHHPAAFATLEQAFDPAANATYAARFLGKLYAVTRDWTRATAFYHSATPELGESYQRRVAAVWPAEQRHGGVGLSLDQANAWSSNAFTRNAWNTAGPPPSGPLARSGRPLAGAGLPAARLGMAGLPAATRF